MNWFNTLGRFVDGLAKSDVVRDMVIQASHDIYTPKTDRDKGYTEVKFANEGDDLRILGTDNECPMGGFRVMNMDNNEQIETIQFTDLDTDNVL